VFEKRKILTYLTRAAATAVLLASLCACGQGGGEVSDTTTSGTVAVPDTVTTVAPVTTEAPSTVLIENGASDYVVITPRSVSAEITAATREFISDLEKKSGVKLKLYPESWAETDCEIVVGYVRDREESAALMVKTDYTSWSVSQSGNKFFVTAYDAEGVERGLKALMACIEEQDGKWIVKGDVQVGGSAWKGHTVPVCESRGSTVAGLYACGEESLEVCLRAVSAEEYTAYGTTLTEAGWVKYTDNQMANNLFATYTNDALGKTLHLGYYPTLQGGTLRIISEPMGYLPPVEAAAYTRVVDTTFAQLKRQSVETNAAPGMSYVMQVADGSFIIVDGGPSSTADSTALMTYLEQLTPAGQKPTVAAWIITHSHSDHMGLANDFLNLYHDRIDVKMAIYNFPTYEAIIDAQDASTAFLVRIDTFIGTIKKYWPEAEHFVFHAGQTLTIADAEIEFLFTHEDQYPMEFAWINHTSIAFRITAGGKNVLLLGDCEKTICQQMAATFGDYLKSDMLQLSHHGNNGGSLDLYQCIDPEICFWACSQRTFETDEKRLGTANGYDFNAYLRNESIRVRQHYHNSVTTVIPMS